MKKLPLMIIGLLLIGDVTAQVDSASSIYSGTEDERMEEFVQRNQSVIDFSDNSAVNLFYKGGKININGATDDELAALHLNDIQIENLNTYIQKYGVLAGVYELNLVEGFDSALIVRLAPLISFKISKELHKISLKSLTGEGRHSLLGKWSRISGLQKGYINDTYAGSPDKIVVKYGYKFYNRLRFGISMEKDPGESFNHGFDYYSAHLFYQGKGFVRSLALGDYYLRFGQGLTVNNSFQLFNDLIPTVPVSPINMIKPSTGINESRPFRGSAVTLAPLRQTRLTIFYSQKNLDAGTNETSSVNDSILTHFNTVGSLHETGLHRTAREIADKAKIGQTVYGGNINASVGLLKVGATVVTTEFSSLINPDHELYNQFRFRGKSMTGYGLDMRAIFGHLNIAGEISMSGEGGSALFANIQYLPYSDFGFSLNYRNYERNFCNPYSNAWSQSSTCTNEQGFSAGLFFKPSKHTTLSAWADHYLHPWLTYRVDAPSSGIEYLMKLQYLKPGAEECQIKYSFNHKQGDATNSERHNIRLHLSYHPFRNIVLKNRIEIALDKINASEPTTGFMIYQDVIIKPAKQNYQLNLRYALFNTDTFNERIYVREDDVPYSYSIVPYHYNGSRIYITAKYSVNRFADIWLRYAHDFYYNRKFIGTGNEEIEGNTRSEISMQMMLKL